MGVGQATLGRSLDDLVASRFAHDAQGRLTGSAPALYVLHTRDAVVVRCHGRLSQDIAERLDAITGRPRGRPREWAQEYGAYLDTLAKVAPIASMRAGPLYVCPPDLRSAGPCVRVGPDNAALLAGGGLDEWSPDANAGVLMLAVVDSGRAVSLCASVRATPAFHHAGVETAPASRGRGFAGRAVAAWANEVRSLGAAPLYGTTFDNLASQTVARRLGLELIGSEFEVELAAL